MADSAGIDPRQLAEWAKGRAARMKSPIAKAIYEGLATRATRPDGFEASEGERS